MKEAELNIFIKKEKGGKVHHQLCIDLGSFGGSKLRKPRKAILHTVGVDPIIQWPWLIMV